MNSLKKISMLFLLFVFSGNICFSQTAISNISDEQKIEVEKNVKAFMQSLQLS